MAKSYTTVATFGQTHPGRVRNENEDNYKIPKPVEIAKLIDKKGTIMIVADGMGGHRAGEVASDLAVRIIYQHYYSNFNDQNERILVEAVQKANYRIKAEAESNVQQHGMGTTLTAAVVQGNRAFIVNVGDSRTYIIKKNTIKQVTRDHSVVGELGLSAEEARRSAYRNQITRALGKDYQVDIDLFVEYVQEGDIILLCTDGLINHVNDDEMVKIAQSTKLENVPAALIQLACDRGGSDNITVVVGQVGMVVPNSNHSATRQNNSGTTQTLKKKKSAHKWLGVIIVFLSLLLLGIAAVFIIYRFSHANKPAKSDQKSEALIIETEFIKWKNATLKLSASELGKLDSSSATGKMYRKLKTPIKEIQDILEEEKQHSNTNREIQ